LVWKQTIWQPCNSMLSSQKELGNADSFKLLGSLSQRIIYRSFYCEVGTYV
jgi:hypothetical protein